VRFRHNPTAMDRRPNPRWKPRVLRPRRRHRLGSWWRFPAAYAALALVAISAAMCRSRPVEWTAETRRSHQAAAPNYDAARAVGLAPAARGQPVYWPHLDANQDGIACEP
jgi:hypothetical protein